MRPRHFDSSLSGIEGDEDDDHNNNNIAEEPPLSILRIHIPRIDDNDIIQMGGIAHPNPLLTSEIAPASPELVIIDGDNHQNEPQLPAWSGSPSGSIESHSLRLQPSRSPSPDNNASELRNLAAQLATQNAVATLPLPHAGGEIQQGHIDDDTFYNTTANRPGMMELAVGPG